MEELLHFSSPRQLSQLYAGRTANLQYIERLFDVSLTTRDNWVQLSGEAFAINQAKAAFHYLDKARAQGIRLQDADVLKIVQQVANQNTDALDEQFDNPLIIKTKDKSLAPKTLNQKRYLQWIQDYEVVFGVGPAGTGKTYLAVASALHTLFSGKVEKIILTRPAVESGEALGFLPGDLEEKILPYLRPLYDAMDDILGPEDSGRLISKGVVEIAPLAYMRGRTLSNAFIILDEAQNTTHEQMMMFLTRLGDRSRMVITGDITQIDLPHTKPSGLKEAVKILNTIEGIKIFEFEGIDVVRHPLVQRIIEAYSKNALSTSRSHNI